MTKTIGRISSLSAVLGLVALAGASGAANTCRYTCRDSTTGQTTIRTTTSSEAACCSGTGGVSCPTGSVYTGPISWNNLFIKRC